MQQLKIDQSDEHEKRRDGFDRMGGGGGGQVPQEWSDHPCGAVRVCVLVGWGGDVMRCVIGSGWDGFMMKDDSEVEGGRMPDRIFPGVASGILGWRE